MGVQIDTENRKSIFSCNTCGKVHETGAADGVAPDDWGTGQLSIDDGLSVIYQIPIFFCPDHRFRVMSGARVILEGMPYELRD